MEQEIGAQQRDENGRADRDYNRRAQGCSPVMSPYIPSDCNDCYWAIAARPLRRSKADQPQMGGYATVPFGRPRDKNRRYSSIFQ